MFEYVVSDVSEYRTVTRGDLAGVIIFGRERPLKSLRSQATSIG
jgi:hypothetical protein